MIPTMTDNQDAGKAAAQATATDLPADHAVRRKPQLLRGALKRYGLDGSVYVVEGADHRAAVLIPYGQDDRRPDSFLLVFWSGRLSERNALNGYLGATVKKLQDRGALPLRAGTAAGKAAA